MPIEIRELIIKATVSSKNNTANSSNNSNSSKLSESQINDIADRIFEIIKEKSER